MAAGLTVYNDYGTVQIDENWKNMSFRERRGHGVSAGSGNPVYVEQSFSGEAAMMACQSTIYHPYLLGTEYNGTTWTYRWLFYPRFVTGDVADVVYFYIFDTMSQPSSKTCGFQIFNASGQLVFHDEMRPMKMSAPQICSSGFVGVGGRTYVPLMLRAPLRAQDVAPLPAGGWWLEIYSLRVNAHTIYPTQYVIGRNVLPLDDHGLYSAVDVTGLV